MNAIRRDLLLDTIAIREHDFSCYEMVMAVKPTGPKARRALGFPESSGSESLIGLGTAVRSNPR